MSKSHNKTCFDMPFLQKYLEEQLSEADESEVQGHISTCRECQQTLERAAADRTMWDSLREHLTFAHPPSDPAMDDHRLQRLIEYLGPTDNPDMLGRLGPYEVIGLIGQGSTGIVMKALEPRLNRFVAIKVLSPTLSSNGAARQRFEREGRAVAAVSHQHVVPIYAVDEFRGLPYIVMQYVAGVSLQQRIDKNGPLDTQEVMRIGLQVAKGLAAAHAQGIVHRDVKPANVLLENTVERAMVTDFGLARVADDASMTRSGTIAGTPQYMSPEQARGETIDPRSDLFSLGSLMYAACTARPPFRAETFFGVINRVCQTDPRPIREINPGIDEWLVAFVDRLIAKRPEDRFQSAGEVSEKLSAALAYMQNPTSVVRPAFEQSSRPARKTSGVNVKRLAIGLVACVATLVTAAAVFYPRNLTENRLFSSLAPATQRIQKAEGGPNQASVVPAVYLEDAKAALTTNLGEWNGNSAGAFEHTLEQTFPIQENGKLVLNADQGDVLVQPSELNDRITVTTVRRIAAGSREEAETLLGHHTLELEATGNTLTVRARLDEAFAERDGGKTFERILYRVSVPRRFNPEIATSNGNITVGTLTGDVSAKTEMGGISLARIDGNVAAEATGGDIDFSKGCTGTADVLTIRGDAYVANVSGSARVRASGGDVWLGESDGRVTVHTSGGDIIVDDLNGPTRVRAADGNVYVHLQKSPPEDCRFNASQGNVDIRMLKDVAVNLQVRGERAGDMAFRPVKADPDDESGAPWFESRFNGGGARVRAVSSSGSVSVNVFDTRDEVCALGGLAPKVSLGGNGSLGGSGSHGGGLSGSGSGGSGLGGSGGLGGSDSHGSGLSGSGSGGSGLGGSGGLGGSDSHDGGLSGSGSGGSGLGGSGGLGGSDSHGSGLSGSGSGGSGSGGSRLSGRSKTLSEHARAKTTGRPRPGAIATVQLPGDGLMDGYTLYLPKSHGANEEPTPIIVYLQGAYSVGGPISGISNWGLPRLIRDESDLSTERNRLLLDSFIVVSPHIQDGQYYAHAALVKQIIHDVAAKYQGDLDRVYLTGLSRGGHGTWGLASRLPGTFAAIAPIGGSPNSVGDFSKIAETAVWIAHNTGDPVASFPDAESAARKLEKIGNVEFLRIDKADVSGTDYLSHRHILTAPRIDGHDAWTDTYTSAEFYKWLLRQSKTPRH